MPFSLCLFYCHYFYFIFAIITSTVAERDKYWKKMNVNSHRVLVFALFLHEFSNWNAFSALFCIFALFLHEFWNRTCIFCIFFAFLAEFWGRWCKKKAWGCSWNKKELKMFIGIKETTWSRLVPCCWFVLQNYLTFLHLKILYILEYENNRLYW